MNITKEDFYCGSFLSFLLNNKIVPTLFEERIDKSRKIYDFTTDKGDFRVYVKFTENPSSESTLKNSSIWSFPFTDNQIDELKSLKCEGRKLFFAFLCGKTALNKSKIAVISDDVVFQCMDVNRASKYKSQSIKVRLIKGHWAFDVYGTARDDKKEGKDNTLKERVNNIGELFDSKEKSEVV